MDNIAAITYRYLGTHSLMVLESQNTDIKRFRPKGFMKANMIESKPSRSTIVPR